jgi:hypothetical protein
MHTEKLASVEIAGVPPAVAVDEDQETELTFTVRNRGNVDSESEVTVRSNLAPSLLEQRGTLLPVGAQPLKIRVLGTYRTLPDGATDIRNTLSAIGIRVRHTDQSGKWREAVDGIINVPVKVHAKKTKLATDRCSWIRSKLACSSAGAATGCSSRVVRQRSIAETSEYAFLARTCFLKRP